MASEKTIENALNELIVKATEAGGCIDIFRLGGAESCEHFKQNKEKITEV